MSLGLMMRHHALLAAAAKKGGGGFPDGYEAVDYLEVKGGFSGSTAVYTTNYNFKKNE